MLKDDGERIRKLIVQRDLCASTYKTSKYDTENCPAEKETTQNGRRLLSVRHIEHVRGDYEMVNKDKPFFYKHMGKSFHTLRNMPQDQEGSILPANHFHTLSDVSFDEFFVYFTFFNLMVCLRMPYYRVKRLLSW